MAIVFGVRGDSIDARYSSGGKTGVKVGDTANITINVDASYLSGSNIQCVAGTAKILTWPGRLNTPNGRALSMLHRYSPQYTGSPASSRVVTPGLYVTPDRMGRIEITHSAAGNLTVTAVNEAGTAVINTVSAGAWSPVSGTIYDVVFTWDGTTTANSFKVYVDAVLIGAGITPTAAFTASWTNQYYNSIAYGNASTSSLAASKTDEIVIWDSVITPSSVALDSGTGSLNGAARTSLVTVSAFDGLSYTDPGIANVKTGTGYTYAGSALTGTYDGSDRWTDPGVANVRLSTAYKANSTVNNRTGTVRVPGIANVKTGFAYDSSDSLTGTYDGSDRWTDPGTTNVRLSTAYKANSTTNNKTGSLDLPVVGDVRLGVVYDNTTKTGTFASATAAEVATAVWDELTASHTTAGSYGVLMTKLLSVAKFIGLK